MKTLKIAATAVLLLITLSLGTATITHAGIQPLKKSELECLARNIYHEARGEPLEGQIAVAQVTLNRVRSPEFDNTVCAVVYAPSQFSWTLDKTKRVRDSVAWQRSLAIAQAVLSNSIKLPKFSALYFHTPQVNPRWSRGKRIVARIGNHIFYS